METEYTLEYLSEEFGRHVVESERLKIQRSFLDPDQQWPENDFKLSLALKNMCDGIIEMQKQLDELQESIKGLK